MKPQKSERRAFAEPDIPQATVHNFLKVKPQDCAYEIQVVQMLQEEYYHARLDFCKQIRLKITESHGFLEQLTFSNKALFHISWRSQRTHLGDAETSVWKHERDSPKLSIWCALSKSRTIGPFFFNEAKVNGECYRVILQDFLTHEQGQLNLLDGNFLQQNGATCRYASTL
jgi:hypothetical protein